MRICFQLSKFKGSVFKMKLVILLIWLPVLQCLTQYGTNEDVEESISKGENALVQVTEKFSPSPGI